MSKYYSDRIVWHFMKKICSSSISGEELVKIFKEMPTADVQEVKHRKWIYDEENECFVCPECKYSSLNNYRGLSVDSDYCHKCGTKMDGETK